MTTRWLGTALVTLTAMIFATAPAQAQSKEAMHDEMVSIAQSGALKTDAALRARYEQLSALLGGDDPGAIFGGPAGQPGPEGGGALVPPGCQSSSNTVAATDTPLAIPDGPGGMVASTIAVAGLTTYIADVNVEVDITHTFAGDLEITVTSPAGTVVTLTTDNGGGNDDVFAGTRFDDDGGDSNPPGPVTDNTFANLVVETPLAPEESLAALIGQNPNGMWTIDVTDDTGLDTGTLNGWSVTILTLAVPPMALVDGPFASSDTPLPIPDGPGGMVASSISVVGVNTFICGANITTDITHTFSADLEITVTSPGGTISTMTTGNGGGNDDVFAGTFWNSNADFLNPPGAPSDTVFADLVTETPLTFEESLGAFIGEDPNGSWTIDVTDAAGLDTGTLNSWEVGFTTCTCAVAVPPVIEVPTQSPLGLLLLAILLGAGAVYLVRRRRFV